MIAVFASTLSQIEGSGLVEREELGHTVAVVKMRVTQDAHVDFREVHAHHARILGEQVRRPRIEQVALVLEFHIHREAPLAKELAGAARAGDVVDEDLDFHFADSLKRLAVAEGVADAAFHYIVAVARGVVADRGELFDREFSVLVEHRFVGCHVHDFAEQEFGFFVVAYKLAFQRERKFRNQRGIDMGAPDRCQAGMGELVGHLVARGDAQIVNGLDVLLVRHAHGERLAGKDVRHGLMAMRHVNGHLVRIANGAPSGHHRIRGTILVIGRNDQCRLRVEISLDSKILTHRKTPFFRDELGYAS